MRLAIAAPLSRRGVLFTDGGFAHLHNHLTASGNFGQVIRKNYPVARRTRASETVVSVGRSTAYTSRCHRGPDVRLPNQTTWSSLSHSGWYRAPLGFLSHLMPLEVLV